MKSKRSNRKRKKYMREYMAKRRQPKKNDGNEEASATRVSCRTDEHNTTIKESLIKRCICIRSIQILNKKDLEKRL